MRVSPDVIAAVISERHAIGRHVRREIAARVQAARGSHFEDVRVVSAEGPDQPEQTRRERRSWSPRRADRARRPRETSRSRRGASPVRDATPALVDQRWVGQRDRSWSDRAADEGIEIQERVLLQFQGETRQEAGAVVEEPSSPSPPGRISPAWSNTANVSPSFSTRGRPPAASDAATRWDSVMMRRVRSMHLPSYTLTYSRAMRGASKRASKARRQACRSISSIRPTASTAASVVRR